jgi:LacI family transcriptional regulator
MTKARRIALLFDVNPEFNRGIMPGIAAYFGSMGAHWQLFVEEDFRLRLFGIEQWQRDGSIPRRAASASTATSQQDHGRKSGRTT